MSEFRNCFRVVSATSHKEAVEFAKLTYPSDYSMVYSEAQWVNYEGKTQAVRFNLKEIK